MGICGSRFVDRLNRVFDPWTRFFERSSVLWGTWVTCLFGAQIAYFLTDVFKKKIAKEDPTGTIFNTIMAGLGYIALTVLLYHTECADTIRESLATPRARHLCSLLKSGFDMGVLRLTILLGDLFGDEEYKDFWNAICFAFLVLHFGCLMKLLHILQDAGLVDGLISVMVTIAVHFSRRLQPIYQGLANFVCVVVIILRNVVIGLYTFPGREDNGDNARRGGGGGDTELGDGQAVPADNGRNGRGRNGRGRNGRGRGGRRNRLSF